jgi:hypothetical protein
MRAWSSRGAVLALGLVVAATGCGLRAPQWLRPGPERWQRERAAIHDPYADTDAGPQVIGGRPRDFQYQRPEAVRSRQFMDTRPSF